MPIIDDIIVSVGTQRESYAGGPTGFRRLTPSLLQADHAADDFDGLPDGVDVPSQLLAALKAAAPRLGLSVRLVHAVDWLFRFTREEDWEIGSQPIVWPSACLQQEALGLSKSGVQSINRSLIEAGLVTMKDSPNGKRYGIRDGKGRIIEAYGFDLSPIAARYGEFVQAATEAKAERELIRQLRRRATIARKGIIQILETAAEYEFEGEEWSRLRQETRALVKSLRAFERSEEIAIGVAGLERRQIEARTRLEQLLEAMETKPKGPENSTHNIPTKAGTDLYEDTVVASKGRSSPPGPEPESGEKQIPPSRTDSGTVMKLSIGELLRLAPGLRTYVQSPCPAWPEIVNAADWLRGELGISKSLWGEACATMGREQAAIAIGLVSAKPAEHFRTSPGGYFHGMVAKARAGELNLARTVWGLRQGADHRTGGRAPS